MRAHYDTPRWHAEAAHGRSERAGGPGTKDYRVDGAAVKFQGQAWTFEAEWIKGRNVRGVDGWGERVYFVHGGYRLRPALELVARHYEGRSTVAGGSTNLSNTYIGATKHFEGSARMTARLQLNYVLVRGDEAAYTGIRGYRDDAILLQLQVQALR